MNKGVPKFLRLGPKLGAIFEKQKIIKVLKIPLFPKSRRENEKVFRPLNGLLKRVPRPQIKKPKEIT